MVRSNVGLQHWIPALGNGHQHGHQPQADGQQHEERPRQRLQPVGTGGGADLLPVGPDSRDQDQQGQQPHPLGDDAEPGGKPAEPVPAPPATTEEEAQKTIETEGDEEGD